MKLPVFEVAAVEAPKTIKELAKAYKRSSKFAELAAVTRSDYDRQLLTMVQSPYGNSNPTAITPQLADTIYQYVKQERGERQAQYFVAVWSVVYMYGMKFLGLLVNPWQLVSPSKPAARKQSWTEEQVFSVIEKALELGEKSVAIGVCLMYDTAQRPGDVLRLTYGDVKKDDSGWFLDFTQSKRKADVRPALSQYTVSLLDPVFINGTNPYYPLTDRLLNWEGTLVEFRAKFNEIKKLCNIPKELQLRDLRRTALTEMGAASDDQMVAVSGHSDRNMLGVYSLKSRTKALEAQQIRYETRNSKLNTKCGVT